MDVLTLVNRLSSSIFGGKSDDDFSDRLNYRYTVGLLILFSIILTTRQYGSEVIKCWVPAHFTNNYEQYVSQICWIQNTYYFPANATIPKSEIERNKNEIKYYQWVSFLLLIQALLFYMPRIFWSTFSVKAGLNICDLVDAAHNYKSAEKFENQKNYMSYLVKNIDQFVDDNRRHDELRKGSKISKCVFTLFPCCGRFLGNYIVILYFIVKLVYICNTIFQVYLISGLLGKDFWLFGFSFIHAMISGQGWNMANSKYFPKVTLCDFMIREIGNPAKSHRYTVQCVLPINLFNQQIFTIIWFWYVIVLVCNIASLVVWFQRCLPFKANTWIKRRVDLFNEDVKQKKLVNRLRHYMDYYLEADGIFMIRMIANNTSDYVATDLIHHLWCQHDEKYGAKFPKEPHRSKKNCLFLHTKQNETDDSSCLNEKIEIIRQHSSAENYASFPLNYADHSKQIDKINGYQTQLSQNEQIKFNLIQDDRNFYHDEGTMLMRNRSNQNIQNIGAPSTKV